MTYKIDSPDNNWHAEISARHGANVVKLQYNNKDIFVPLISDEQLNTNPYIQGCPILLPANRTYAGKFSFEDKEYNLLLNEPQNNAHLHGLVHTMAFNLVVHQQNKIILEYINKGECYPFDFRLEVTYILKDDGFYQYYKIKNIGNRNMPFTFALHTTFVEPECFSVPISCCQEKDDHHIPTGRFVPLNSQEEKYASGSPSEDLVISGYYKSNGNTAQIGCFKYTVSDNFDYWILFNGKGESNLLCVEPQCGAVNGLNMKDGCVILESGKDIEFFTVISK